MKTILKITLIAALASSAACTNLASKNQPSASTFAGTYADNCATPSSSFAFRDGGNGSINARGQSRNFTWYQKGNVAYVSVPSQGGTPAQTYGLTRTQSGIYLSSLAVNGQTQDITKASASERTKVKCA